MKKRSEEPSTEYRITVQGISDEFRWDKESSTFKDGLGLLKKGTLQFPDRTIVLDPNRIPMVMKQLLDKVE